MFFDINANNTFASLIKQDGRTHIPHAFLRHYRKTGNWHDYGGTAIIHDSAAKQCDLRSTTVKELNVWILYLCSKLNVNMLFLMDGIFFANGAYTKPQLLEFFISLYNELAKINNQAVFLKRLSEFDATAPLETVRDAIVAEFQQNDIADEYILAVLFS